MPKSAGKSKPVLYTGCGMAAAGELKYFNLNALNETKLPLTIPTKIKYLIVNITSPFTIKVIHHFYF